MATPKSACSATLPSRGKQPCARRHSSETLTALLQQRQLGIPTTQRIRSKASNNLELCRTWRGASGDVIVLGWSPDGTRFAAGAAAQCDHHNMAYNRNNNLLVGDLTKNSLEELPYHWVRRPPTRAAANPNLHDARLFMSVTAVEWWDDALFTASYDNTVKLWQPTSRSAENHKRLWHDSRVEVMARSSYTPNLLATGTRSIGLWRLEEMDYQPLEARERRSNKAIEMVPSSLAWGNTQATGNILLAGMSEKGHESLTPDGQLAGWHVGEASITPLSLSPSSQNVYDIKWHPSLPYAAVANYIGHSISKAYKESRSSVRLYQPLSSKVTYMEFECPALDINDVTFCPMNTNYVTASCTDGATYVWDFRNPARILHELRHGEPLNPWDENLGREQADVGVRAALWGSTIGEFYSGGSDGVLKRWNILRAPEDALDQDVANFNEEIMSLSFSPDKSNLLVGDAAGGVHILSSGPFSRTEQCSIDYKPASPPPESMPFEDTESGIAAGAELLRSGQLERHPLFGVGQGPYYDGPFAAWARPEGTPLDEIAYTMLADECQARQIDGLDPKYRLGLTEEEKQQVAAQRRLAQIRNQRAGYKKRIREDTTSVINLCSDDDVKPPTSPDNSKRRLAKPKITVSEIEVIDLTGDPVQLPDRPVSARPMPTRLWSLVDEDLAETLEEDHWWPPNETVDANIQDMDCI
ncbi:WD repeat protein [Aspergillus homomorphus CBS 101889]|uniref:WD40 repeat-like protein n=1 Tax=Aspergillus homomorphus (strain CBS 101889) TaxID=1450537 RepID=A0A395I6Y0_ASPHC|nr:WD40 repeat-like protein [Aspergillus homomorphus CBS 101889]RAL15837.1 WD40 repeat-like protein [Aspergillus homomorphus CBS 101889]